MHKKAPAEHAWQPGICPLYAGCGAGNVKRLKRSSHSCSQRLTPAAFPTPPILLFPPHPHRKRFQCVRLSLPLPYVMNTRVAGVGPSTLPVSLKLCTHHSHTLERATDHSDHLSSLKRPRRSHPLRHQRNAPLRKIAPLGRWIPSSITSDSIALLSAILKLQSHTLLVSACMVPSLTGRHLKATARHILQPSVYLPPSYISVTPKMTRAAAQPSALRRPPVAFSTTANTSKGAIVLAPVQRYPASALAAHTAAPQTFESQKMRLHRRSPWPCVRGRRGHLLGDL